MTVVRVIFHFTNWQPEGGEIILALPFSLGPAQSPCMARTRLRSAFAVGVMEGGRSGMPGHGGYNRCLLPCLVYDMPFVNGGRFCLWRMGEEKCSLRMGVGCYSCCSPWQHHCPPVVYSHAPAAAGRLHLPGAHASPLKDPYIPEAWMACKRGSKWPRLETFRERMLFPFTRASN